MNKIIYSDQSFLAKLFRFLFWWTGANNSDTPLKCDLDLPTNICSMFWSIVFGIIIFPFTSSVGFLSLLMGPLFNRLPQGFHNFIDRPPSRKEIVIIMTVLYSISITMILMRTYEFCKYEELNIIQKFIFNVGVFAIMLAIAGTVFLIGHFVIMLLSKVFEKVRYSFIGRFVQDFKDRTCSLIEWETEKQSFEFEHDYGVIEIIHFPEMTAEEGVLHINEDEELCKYARMWVPDEGTIIQGYNKNMIITNKGIFFIVWED